MPRFLRVLVLASLALLAPACPSGAPAVLQSITLAPTNATLPCNYSFAYVATGHYSDGSTQDLSAVVTWVVNNNSNGSGFATANISALGVVTSGGVQGTALITATEGLIVRSTLLMIDGSFNELYVQVYQTLVGVGNNGFTFADPAEDLPPDGTADGTEAPGPSPSGAWNLKGVQPKGGFTTWIRAVAKVGDTSKWTNVTSSVTWTLDDPGGTGTTFDPVTGRVTCGSVPGTVYFSAVLSPLVKSSPQTGTAKANGEIKIADAALATVAINPQNVSNPADPHFGADPVYIPVGATQPLKVTGTFSGPDAGGYCINWDMAYSSSNTSHAAVDASGLLTAVGMGTANVTAKIGATISDTIPVNVGAAEVVYLEISPPTATMATDLNASTQLHAFAHYTDGSSRDVYNDFDTTWSVASPSPVLTVSTQDMGLVRNDTGVSGDSNEIGASYASIFVSPTGVSSTKVTCSDSGAPAQTAPRYLDAMGMPVNLNATIFLQ